MLRIAQKGNLRRGDRTRQRLRRGGAVNTPSSFRRSSSDSLAMLAAMREPRRGMLGYRSRFGFHSRASFCASAICAGVITDAT